MTRSPFRHANGPVRVAAIGLAAMVAAAIVSMGAVSQARAQTRDPGCQTVPGRAAVLDAAGVEHVQDLTEQSLRAIVEAPAAVFIHWRWEGIGDNETGDRYFCEMVGEFGPRFARLIQIEGRDYRFRMRRIKEVLDEYSPRAAYNTHELPNYSVAGFGDEARIEGPPDPDRYAEEYEAWRGPVGGYIEDLGTD